MGVNRVFALKGSPSRATSTNWWGSLPPRATDHTLLNNVDEMITRGNANPFLSASAVQALLHRRTPVLFLGNGPRTQYADVNAVMESADVPLRQLRKEFGDSLIAVFGGDTCIEGEPDLGVLMREVKGRHDMPLLAVVGWDEVDQHIDFAFRYVTKQSEDSGREVYGGFDSSTGVPLGGTAVYLGQWLSQLRAVVAFEPRGSVGRAELAFARDIPGLRVIEVQAAARFQPKPPV